MNQKMIHYVIGASAGGFEAISTIVEAIPADFEGVLIIAIHLSPKQDSMLSSLLQRRTAMNIVSIGERETLESGNIYVVRPNSDYVLEGKDIVSVPLGINQKGRPSINRLIKSFADICPEETVGIILSGTGSDGTEAVKYLHERGGFIIAQSTSSAKHIGMPKSAIGTRCVDMIAPAEEIGQIILNSSTLLNSKKSYLEELHESGGDLSTLFKALEESSFIDFSKYKRATVDRRIARRVLATKAKGLKEYVDFIKENPQETINLKNELLIGVTGFFRDKAEFRVLKERLREYVKEHPKATYRFWCAGCSTGEEAYSLAITMFEVLAESKLDSQFKVYASDVSEKSLAFARKGIYSNKLMEGVSDLRTRDFFDKLDDNHFKVHSTLRNAVAFANHNIFQDPAFLKLDLVSCRNVLIYFNSLSATEAQLRLCNGILKDGLYFIGQADSIGRLSEDFEEIEDNIKIFRRKAVTKQFVNEKGLKRGFGLSYFEREKEASFKSSLTMRSKVPLADAFPDSLLLDNRQQVIGVYGAAEELLEIPSGQFTNDISYLLKKEYKVPFLILLGLKNPSSSFEFLSETEDGRLIFAQRENLQCSPDALQLVRLVILQKNTQLANLYSKSSDSADEKTRELVGSLVSEVKDLRHHLELKKTEFHSVVEDLQSTNEEFETSNEELQSTNEELITVNEELQFKGEEIEKYRRFLDSVIDHLDIPVFAINSHFKITVCNSFAKVLLDSIGISLPAGLRSAGSSEIKASLKAKFIELFAQDEEKIVDEIFSLKIGTTTYSVVVKNMKAVDGFPVMLVLFKDITLDSERIRVLETSLFMLAGCLETSGRAVTVVSNNGKHVFSNSAVERLEQSTGEKVRKITSKGLKVYELVERPNFIEEKEMSFEGTSKHRFLSSIPGSQVESFKDHEGNLYLSLWIETNS